MDAFGIEEGSCGAGEGRYAAGLITLPDGSLRGVESVSGIVIRQPVRTDAGLERAGRTTGEVAGSFRAALGSPRTPSLPLALRLAVSTMRAGLGAIEEGLRPPGDVTVEIAFADGSAITALMPPDIAALIRRDAGIARGVLERAGRGDGAAPAAPSTAPDEALTSIFRYEKRNGRLRRVAASGKPEA